MSLTNDYKVRAFEAEDRQDVIELWQACELTRPWNDANKDLDRMLGDPVGKLFVLTRGKQVSDQVPTLIGTVMASYDGHRGAIYYLGIHPDHQSSGAGRVLMAHSESYLKDLGCPKINLMVRSTNLSVIQFYKKLDYSEEPVVVMGKRLIPDI
ncbi:GNAT family acetyltransferase [Roseibium algae]|uniref:GNAT family acetyltransferase n=1 Tax=Roseibium algae TaxID=3123038 RepID=A0ABU8TN22_9HYPH